MRTFVTMLVWIAAIATVVAAIAFVAVLPGFFSARTTPARWEEGAVLWLRRHSIPREIRESRNPIELSADVLAQGRDHFADHCAMCHGNDGSGKTEIGENAYPRTPDLRRERTQSMSDGELFYTIQNGIRFSGMPAWGAGHHDEESSWKLVHFIRHLPTLSNADLREMEAQQPKGPRPSERRGDVDQPATDDEKHPHRHGEEHPHH